MVRTRPAVLVQHERDAAAWFQASMKVRMASVSCLTDVNETRWMTSRVMMDETGTQVHSRVGRGELQLDCGFFASHFFTSAWLRAE